MDIVTNIASRLNLRMYVLLQHLHLLGEICCLFILHWPVSHFIFYSSAILTIALLQKPSSVVCTPLWWSLFNEGLESFWHKWMQPFPVNVFIFNNVLPLLFIFITWENPHSRFPQLAPAFLGLSFTFCAVMFSLFCTVLQVSYCFALLLL